MEYTKSKTVVQTEYADIDLFFKPHPITGDVSLKYDDAAVKRSVRNIVQTNLNQESIMYLYDYNLKTTT